MSDLTDCTDLKQRITHIIRDEVAPMLQLDGGDIEVLSVTEDGIVQVRFTGTCGCCPSTVQSVIMGIEQELRQRVPEVAYLEAVP